MGQLTPQQEIKEERRDDKRDDKQDRRDDKRDDKRDRRDAQRNYRHTWTGSPRQVTDAARLPGLDGTR